MVKISPVIVLTVLLSMIIAANARDPQKSIFSRFGCMGVYDSAMLARLSRVCEDCYQLYREADVHMLCTSNCFKNDFFTQCVDALLMKKEHRKFDQMIEIFHRRKKNVVDFPYH